MREEIPPQESAAAPVAWRDHTIVRPLTMILAAGTVLAVLEPFGSGLLGWPWQWVYWVGLMGVGYASTQGVILALRPLKLSMRPLAQNILHGALASIPITAVVITINSVLAGRILALEHWSTVYVGVAVITAVMTTIGELVDRASAAHPPQASARATSAPTTREREFRDRLPARLRQGEILAVASEDHYLRVYTDRGDDLILMRLRDAETELSTADGMRVHRSWWVARDAVKQIDRDNGRMRLTLANGITAPVSRSYAAAVREAGWV